MEKFSLLLVSLEQVIERLREALAEPKTAITRDSAIKRFELAFDLSWKTLKALLEEQKGVVSRSPKDTFREAYNNGVIEFDNYWISLTDLRNETAHTYKETVAEQVYSQMDEALKHFEQLLQVLKK